MANYTRIFNIYEFIKKTTDPLLYLDLPNEEITDKLTNIVKFNISRKHGRDYYKENEELIMNLLKIYISDEISKNKIDRFKNEEIALYDNTWDIIRNPCPDSPIIDKNIPGLKLDLRLYQQAILYAMRIAETQNYIIDVIGKNDCKISSDACCLSSTIGTGKTVMILAHILYLKNLTDSSSSSSVKNVESNPGLRPVEHLGEARRANQDVRGSISLKSKNCMAIYEPKQFINSSIIFVNSGVYEQWRDEITKTAPTLTVLAIKDANDFKKVISGFKMLIQKPYDIILVKSGDITSAAYAEWESTRPDTIKRHLMNAIASVFNNYTFARLFIDDFDVIKLPENAGGIRAQFYWYVSATNLKHRKTRKNEFALAPFPRNASHWIFDNLSISATEEFITQCNDLPKMKIYETKFGSANQGFLGIMADAAKNDEVLADIMEMINGDSTDAAAEKLGIKATSVHDIFKKILDRSFEPYMNALRMLEKIKILKMLHYSNTVELPKIAIKYINHATRSDNFKFNLIEDNKQFKDAVSILIKKINLSEPKDKDYSESIDVQYQDNDLRNTIRDLEESANNQRNKEGSAIDKLRRTQTECQVCKSTLYDDDEPMDEDVKGTIAMPCCGKMFCSNCAIAGAKFQRYGDKVKGNCPSCRHELAPNEMIYISVKGILGNKIMEDSLTDIKEENVSNNVANVVAVKSDDEIFNEKYPAKFVALLKIVKGELPENAKKIDINYKGLMNGNKDLPDVNDKNKIKILVIAKFKETYVKLAEFLNYYKIKFNLLHGSSTEKRNQVQELQNDPEMKIMILMTSSDCASLNGLQYITDCVFLHRLTSVEVEAQSIGRCQRLGRDRNIPLRVHYLVYSYE